MKIKLPFISRRANERVMAETQEKFVENLRRTNDTLANYSGQITALTDKIANLNKIISTLVKDDRETRRKLKDQLLKQ